MNMGIRFVRPEYDVLHLPSGDTLTVKRRLNAGEQRAYYKRISVYDAQGNVTIDRMERALAVITAYLVDWSVTDNGQLMPIRGLSPEELTAILDNLEPDDFTAIRDAIDAHETRMLAEREALKKTTVGGNGSSPTSLSPDAAAGGTSGLPTLTPTSTTSLSTN